jgi:hypothetical protein
MVWKRLFYTKLIKKADERFAHHLAELKKRGNS